MVGSAYGIFTYEPPTKEDKPAASKEVRVGHNVGSADSTRAGDRNPRMPEFQIKLVLLGTKVSDTQRQLLQSRRSLYRDCLYVWGST